MSIDILKNIYSQFKLQQLNGVITVISQQAPQLVIHVLKRPVKIKHTHTPPSNLIALCVFRVLLSCLSQQ